LCAGCGPVTRLPALDKRAVETEQKREQIAQMRRYFGELHRIDNVAFRVLTANTPFCRGREAPQIGLVATSPQSLPARFRSFGREAMDLSWARPTVVSVAEGSPAARAGIRDHDQLIGFDQELIPVTRTEAWIRDWLHRNGERPVAVDLRRGDSDLVVTVQPVTGCAIPVVYVTDDTANAYTDDRKIVINSGIATLAKTDAQLAAVIGHEMGHIWLRHSRKKLGNMVLGTLAGAAVDGSFLLGTVWTGGAFTREFRKAGLRAYSVAFEREADYAGAYFAARAGYDLAGVEELWSAMGQAHPDSLRFARTHPLAPARFVQMKEVAEEIAEKQRKHLPLVPDIKQAEATAAPDDIAPEK
jgi:Zn-dependent protease with chaperone function